MGRTDDPGQHPCHAVLGNEASTGERTGELGSLGGEPDIAHHGVDEAQPGACPIDRCHNRLGNGQGVVMTLVAQPWRISATLSAAAGNALQVVHVGTGAEAPASTGHHDGSDVGVGCSPVESVEVAGPQLTRPGVQPLGTVQRDDRHAVVNLVQHCVIGIRVICLAAAHLAPPRKWRCIVLADAPSLIAADAAAVTLVRTGPALPRSPCPWCRPRRCRAPHPFPRSHSRTGCRRAAAWHGSRRCR